MERFHYVQGMPKTVTLKNQNEQLTVAMEFASFA